VWLLPTPLPQHLQLVQALIDPEAEIEAWKLVSMVQLLKFFTALLIWRGVCRFDYALQTGSKRDSFHICSSVLQLASLSTAQDNHVEALESFEEARRIAEREGHHNELRRINCLIGVSKGTMEFIRFTEHGSNFADELNM
jgi:hypothetical protein